MELNGFLKISLLMIIIDFLVYYLTYWFEKDKNKKKLVWSTPLERAIYAVVLAITGLFVVLEGFLEDTIWKQTGFKTPALIVGIGALGIFQLLRFIYVKKGRYERIASKKFNLNKKAGVIISITIILLCGVSWIIDMVISYLLMGLK